MHNVFWLQHTWMANRIVCVHIVFIKHFAMQTFISCIGHHIIISGCNSKLAPVEFLALCSVNCQNRYPATQWVIFILIDLFPTCPTYWLWGAELSYPNQWQMNPLQKAASLKTPALFTTSKRQEVQFHLCEMQTKPIMEEVGNLEISESWDAASSVVRGSWWCLSSSPIISHVFPQMLVAFCQSFFKAQGQKYSTVFWDSKCILCDRTKA